jgi:hypothetical protein
MGDYMPPHNGRNHTITINRNLNKYSFFITLLHEIAHLITWNKYKGKVQVHGTEWKTEYRKLLNYFLLMDSLLPDEEKLFPSDVRAALKKHICNPPAAQCSDIQLARTLDRYGEDKNFLTLEKIPSGSHFRIVYSRDKLSKDVYIKGEKRRTRFYCIHAFTHKKYLIHALCKVVVAQ